MSEPLERKASRRTMLGMVAGAATVAGLGVALPATAVDDPIGEEAPIGDGPMTELSPDDIDPNLSAACGATVYQHAEIGGARTFYEPDGRFVAFKYNATFYNRLEAWLNFYFLNTPLPWQPPFTIGSYGAYVNKGDGCSSYHNFGRAFDFSRIRGLNADRETTMFNARYDQWRKLTGSQLTTARRLYWATAASLHYHFKHVLTYLYNSQHHNHIHVDNAVSGSGNSTFTTGASAQVEHVQACCNYIWGRSISIDGVWGSQTSGAVSAVLTRIGRSGSLTTQANWLAFNQATLRMGTGRQTY